MLSGRKDTAKQANMVIRLLFLPMYTSQLNPIEIQWRMIKARLAGRSLVHHRGDLNACNAKESGARQIFIRISPIC